MATRSSVNIIFVLALGVAIFFGARFYLKSSAQAQEIDALRKELDDTYNKLDDKAEQVLEQNRRLENCGKQEANKPDNTLDYFGLFKPKKGPEKYKARAKVAPPKPSSPEPTPSDSPKGPSKEDQEVEQMFREQAEIVYDDLLKELSLPQEQREKFLNHLSKQAKAESEFGEIIMDKNKSIEEVLAGQAQISRKFDQELGAILSPQEKEAADKYRHELPKKMQTKQLLSFIDEPGVGDAERGDAKKIIERAIERAAEAAPAPKRFGQLSAGDIREMREKFGNNNLSDEELLRTAIEEQDAQTQILLEHLRELPQSQYEKLKEQIEIPLKMMRQDLEEL